MNPEKENNNATDKEPSVIESTDLHTTYDDIDPQTHQLTNEKSVKNEPEPAIDSHTELSETQNEKIKLRISLLNRLRADPLRPNEQKVFDSLFEGLSPDDALDKYFRGFTYEAAKDIYKRAYNEVVLRIGSLGASIRFEVDENDRKIPQIISKQVTNPTPRVRENKVEKPGRYQLTEEDKEEILSYNPENYRVYSDDLKLLLSCIEGKTFDLPLDNELKETLERINNNLLNKSGCSIMATPLGNNPNTAKVRFNNEKNYQIKNLKEYVVKKKHFADIKATNPPFNLESEKLGGSTIVYLKGQKGQTDSILLEPKVYTKDGNRIFNNRNQANWRNITGAYLINSNDQYEMARLMLKNPTIPLLVAKKKFGEIGKIYGAKSPQQFETLILLAQNILGKWGFTINRLEIEKETVLQLAKREAIEQTS